jgi:hypothetical protein
MKHNFLKITLVLATFFSLISCDKDYNSLDSDLAADANFNFDSYVAETLAYSKETGAVQSNNLPINALGVYNNAIFGKTKAHFVSQVALATANPTVGTNITIDPVKDSVYVYIPYFSRVDTQATVADTYILDSIYGSTDNSVNLKIYRSGYTLRDFNPNPDPSDITSYSQKYYSDEKGLVESNLIGTPLNNSSNTAENTAFKFSKTQYVKYKTNANGQWLDASGAVTTDTEKRVVKEKFRPGMWINLDKEFFKTQVLQAGTSNLLNNNIFREYFKGLYFQVEENGGQEGAMAMLDFSKGKVFIQYRSDITTTGTNGTQTVTNTKKELVLNLLGNTVNFLEHDKSPKYQTGLNNSDATNGNTQLLLKGGNGSVAYIELFGKDIDNNTIPDQLEQLRSKGWLINEANLVFHIDETAEGMGASGRPKEPRRIYLYDATNNLPLLDYTIDPSTTTNAKNNKFIFGGIMSYTNQDSNLNEPGISYKINITNHINRIINSTDANLNKNVTLGLSVTENISINANANIKTPFQAGQNQIKRIPLGSVMNPLGTILHGSHASVPEAKRLKLQIYYTKPN